MEKRQIIKYLNIWKVADEKFISSYRASRLFWIQQLDIRFCRTLLKVEFK